MVWCPSFRPRFRPCGHPRNGADIIEAINNGALPAPYSGKGVGGRLIEPIYVDEAVEAVNEYRNLQRQRRCCHRLCLSGSCVGIAPIAEELKKLTLFYYCGTTRTFEEGEKQTSSAR